MPRLIAGKRVSSGRCQPTPLTVRAHGTLRPKQAFKVFARRFAARGERENRIKEQPVDLFDDRTSCHKWWPNQVRLPLSSLAFMKYSG